VNLRSDLLLTLVTDRELGGDRPLLQIVEEALTGGATAVQLRDKRSPAGGLLELGSEMRRICRLHGAPLLVNDRADLALALSADGVHLGSEDLPVADARRLLPPPLWIGVSAASVREARSAEEAGADYLGVGPVFATATKADAGDPIGLERLSEIAAAVRIPVVGIGGIGAVNCASVIEAGAAGVAVISAIMAAEDPATSARRMREILDAARSRQDRLS
jgi:thiamine-phosphate pyrophosphorylase